jgi:uncharacterized protein YjbI with pentapeptide repeats
MEAELDIRSHVWRWSPGLLLVAALAAFAAPPALAAPPARVLPAAQVRLLLRSGPVALQGITIRGTLDLRPLGTVEHRLSCRNCRLEGDLVGSGVVFDRTLDLSGSQIAGAVKMEGARFREPVLLGSPPALGPTGFGGRIDFSLAKFDDFVSFEEARFAKYADFVYARFGGEAIFTGGVFAAGVSFDRAWFASAADFRQRMFRSRASLVASEFRGEADFSQARFLREADLSLVRFDGDAAFVGTEFAGFDSESAVSFERATVDGTINFAFSSFWNDADFSRMTARRASFGDAQFRPRPSIVMANFAPADLQMSVGTVLASVQPDERRTILHLIEASAKSRGDLGVANDAHYAQEVLASHGYTWARRSLDFTFYRLAAGYFVRPLRPLTVFVVLVLLFSLARCVRRHHVEPSSRAAPDDRGSRRRRLRLVGRELGLFGSQCLDTISYASRVRARPEVAVGAPTRLEILAYRVLVICVLIGLANSNPTLRQMLDALL